MSIESTSITKDAFPGFLCILFLLLGCPDMQAQTNDSIHSTVKTRWIEKMDEYLAIDLSLNNAYEIFEVKTPANKTIIYPNTPTNLRLKVNYRFITGSFQFAPAFIPGNGDEAIKGKTKSFGLGSSLIFKHWLGDLSYTKVKGFYLQNTEDYKPSWTKGDPYIQFPDLNYNGLALSLGYSSNKNFSFRSLSSQTERQLKSAGTFIPVLNLRYFTIDDRSNGNSTQKTNNLEGSIGPGYAYTFVVKERFYLSLGLSANFGYFNTRLTSRFAAGDIISYQNNFILRMDGKSGIGYNGKRLYTGLYASFSGTEYKQEHTTASNSERRIFYHLTMGLRIQAPKYLKQQLSRIKKLFTHGEAANKRALLVSFHKSASSTRAIMNNLNSSAYYDNYLCSRILRGAITLEV